MTALRNGSFGLSLVPAPRTLVALAGSLARDDRFDRELEALRRALLGQAGSPGADAPGVSGVSGVQGERIRWVDSHPNHSASAEAYELRIGPGSGDGGGGRERGGGVTIIAKRPGARHALATLEQIVRCAEVAGTRDLPALRIKDEPVFVKRGLLLDVSRNKIPTMDSLRGIIDTLAGLKFNHLQLYVEHTFAYAGHERVWSGTGAITPDELRELDGYAAARGVGLAGNQNCFGHLAAWLRRPEYAHLAEIEGDNEWRFMHWPRRGPFSLCPTEPARSGALALVRDLVSRMSVCFDGPLFNINCDETFDVGHGRSRAWVEQRAGELVGGTGGLTREQAEARARGELYFSFVGEVARIVGERGGGGGKRPMMWADGVLAHPELMDRLPREVVPLIWGYEPETDFAAGLRVFAAAGRHDAWVCPGTSAWRSITGRTSESRANIRRAAREGGRVGRPGTAPGLLICEWGDVGHTQHWPASLVRIADAAEAAWGGGDREGGAIADERAVSMHVLGAMRGPSAGEVAGESARGLAGDLAGELAGWINALGDVDLEIRQRGLATYAPGYREGAGEGDGVSPGIRNASAMFTDLFPPVKLEPGKLGPRTRAVDAPRELWVAARDRLEALASARPRSGIELMDRELEHTLSFAALALEHAIAHRPEGGGVVPSGALDPGVRDGLRERAERWLEEHRRLWVLRNRPEGLAESCGHMERVVEGLM